MVIAQCRDCGQVMNYDFREYDKLHRQDKIFCRKCVREYKKRLRNEVKNETA
ncbi:MAG: alpha-aminoadipate carrier protein [Siphoviridae sp. ctjeG17]|nr:MAG: alpha-aminoadipate carrier protein [Siphoviridae sp. ctjeG17]